MLDKIIQNFKPIAFYNEKWTKYIMQAHVHPAFEFMQVLSGHAIINIFDNEFNFEKQYKLNSGDIIFINANIPHQLLIDDTKPCHILNLEISNKEQDIYKIDLGDSKEVNFFTGENKPHFCFADKDAGLSAYFLKLVQELNYSETNDNFTSYSPALLCVFFSEFLRAFYINYSDKFAKFDYIKLINKYIDENFMNTLSTFDIANYVSLNKSYMQKLYKQQTGFTVGEVITAKRLQRACTLIENTDMHYLDIAIEVGYSSRQGFFNAFKNSFGLNPSEYKQKCKSDYN